MLRVSMLAGATLAAILLAAGAAASPMRHTNLPCDPNCGPADLRITGTMDATTAAVGDSLTWRLTVSDANAGPATEVYVDINVPASVAVTSTYADRGTGCTSTGPTTLHCYLDWLADTAQVGHVTVTAKVTATGDHALTAVVGYRAPDPAPADNTVTLTATTPAPPPVPVLPVIAAGTIAPSPVHGKKVAVSFAVTRSDTGAALIDGGTMTASSSIPGKGIANVSVLANGVARVLLVVPKTAKNKVLKVSVTVTTTDGSASKVATFRVR
jgi:Domain of unknown function DUF11